MFPQKKQQQQQKTAHSTRIMKERFGLWNGMQNIIAKLIYVILEPINLYACHFKIVQLWNVNTAFELCEMR